LKREDDKISVAAIDARVGERVRRQRLARHMSQENLSKAIGITAQQLQKYEQGVDRIGAGGLYDLSQALAVPVSSFFEEILVKPADRGNARRRETIELLRIYNQVTDPEIRSSLRNLLEALGVR
jgi:transcriptional regulator with XRE-family HTH domain